MDIRYIVCGSWASISSELGYRVYDDIQVQTLLEFLKGNYIVDEIKETICISLLGKREVSIESFDELILLIEEDALMDYIFEVNRVIECNGFMKAYFSYEEAYEVYDDLVGEPANLIVTLPGVSAQEKDYSDLTAAAFKDGLIPGIWCPEATGDDRLSYPRLASSCDAVISTSVQEGFGYLFLNALHWQKPLLARYLDILDGVLDLFGDYPRRFWADFRIPATPELTRRTQTAYLEKIRKIESSLPEKSVKSISSAVSKLAAGGGIDLSYLRVEDQLDILRNARDDAGWIEKTRLLNRELLDSAGRTLKAKAPLMDKTIEAHYGEGAFVRNFANIISGFGSKTPTPSPAKVRESVRKSFGRIDYLRLLYDD